MTYAYTQENGQVAHCNKLSSIPLGTPFAEVDTLPADKLFRSAWTLYNDAIGEDLEAAQLLAHSMRRAHRSELFKPDDAVVALQIPGQDNASAENRRRNCRDNDAPVQVGIDNAPDEATLRQVLSDYGAIS